MTKVRNLEDAAAMVPDGATIAIGGLSMNATPMAFVRELIRQEKRDLELLAIVNGMAIDWLVAAGCVRRVIAGLVELRGPRPRSQLPPSGPGRHHRVRRVQRAHPHQPPPSGGPQPAVHADQGGTRDRRARHQRRPLAGRGRP